VRRLADPTNMSRQLVVLVPDARPDGRRRQDDDCQQSKSPMTSVMSPFNHSIKRQTKRSRRNCQLETGFPWCTLRCCTRVDGLLAHKSPP